MHPVGCRLPVSPAGSTPGPVAPGCRLRPVLTLICVSLSVGFARYFVVRVVKACLVPGFGTRARFKSNRRQLKTSGNREPRGRSRLGRKGLAGPRAFMATYTCITCRVAFKDGDIQRAHYKTDWHRYNLKRKVADMPPVTAENFQERVLAQRAVAEEQNKITATYCTVCSKRFSTFNAYENHLKSKKHLELEKKAVQAVSKKVKILNEKNLEKGLAPESVNKDEMNTAIQQAIRAQPSSSPKKTPFLPPSNESSSPVSRESAGLSQRRERPEIPPRLQWFEQQARKLAKQQAEEEEDNEEDWEDMDSDEDTGSDGDIGSDEEMESVNEGEEQQAEAESIPAAGAIPVTDCLFCPHHSRSLTKNVAHMTKIHSFFIPDIEYLVDLRGLIKYLGEKVGVGKICIWCNEKGKSFYSTEAVQAHMNDKSHCKLFTDGDAALEFADFYDFRSSYPDHEDGKDVESPVKRPAEKELDYDDDTMELILPSGARVGHRSLMRYYKQRFGVTRDVDVVRNKKAVGRVLRQYRALGWTGQAGAISAQQRDMQYLQRMKSKWMLKTGMSNNATKQMHFRMQVRF